MASITIHGFDEQGRKHEVKLQTDGEELRVLAGRAHMMFQELVPHDVIAAKESAIEGDEPSIDSDMEPGIDLDKRQWARELAGRLMDEVSWSDIEKYAKVADHHPSAIRLMDDIYDYLTNL